MAVSGVLLFFFQAEDGIRDGHVTGVQTCALPISRSGVVAAAAEEVSANIQTVASGAEQMGASIREIAHSANEAAGVAARATDVARSTNATVSQLGTSSQEIGDVIKVITQIAEQTN